jgi:predicted metal-dependent phosphoesterase TrpH
MYKYELHSHTSECDLVAKLSGAELVREYKKAGYDGIVITDHYFELFFEWFQEELDGTTHAVQMDRYLKGYRTAKEEGEKLGFSVIVGTEVRLKDSINDYLVYGLDEEFFYNAPRLTDIKSLDELLAIFPKDACVVHAHPFRNGMQIVKPDLLDGVEIFNGHMDHDSRNVIAQIWAEKFGLKRTAGSDYHYSSQVPNAGMLTDVEVKDVATLVEILKNGQYQLIVG